MTTPEAATPTTSEPTDGRSIQLVRNVVDATGRLLTDFRGPLVVCIPIVIAILRNGIGTFPVLSINQFLAIANHFPQPALLPADAYYIYNSSVGSIISHYIGITTAQGWFALHLVLIVILLVVMGFMAAHAAGKQAVGVVYAVFAAGSISTVLLGWVGSYDVYTVLGLTIAALGRKWWWTGLGALIVGTTNGEMGIVAFVGLVILGWADKKPGILKAVGYLVGLAIGRGLILLWHANYDIPGSRLEYAKEFGFERILELSWQAMPALAMTWVGAATLIVAWAWIHRLGSRWRIVIAFVVTIGPSLLTLDETRTAAVMTWPLVAWLVAVGMRKDPRGMGRAAGATLLISLIVPPLFIWAGHPQIVTWSFLNVGG